MDAAEHRDFAANILFDNEAGFTKDEIFNYHNNHVFSDKNPQAAL